MNSKRSTTCWPCSRARGLTLIEVVAAIAILGTLLAGIVIAQSRHIDQRVRARLQLQAVEATDALIAQWWADRVDGVPIDEQGTLPGVEGLLWKTRVIDNTQIQQLDARVVRVSIFDNAIRPGMQADPERPMFVVDLVVTDPEAKARQQAQTQKRQRLQHRRDRAGVERRGG